MKNFKKLLALGVASTLAMSIMACGSDTTTSTSTSDATADTTAEAEAVETTEASDGIIKIGGIGPTTGGAAIYGIAVMNGAQIAVDEINAAGGINGYTVELNFQDDEHDPEKSVNAYSTDSTRVKLL